MLKLLREKSKLWLHLTHLTSVQMGMWVQSVYILECMCNVIDCRPVEGVVCLLPEIIWDGLQLPVMLDRKSAVEKCVLLPFQRIGVAMRQFCKCLIDDPNDYGSLMNLVTCAGFESNARHTTQNEWVLPFCLSLLPWSVDILSFTFCTNCLHILGLKTKQNISTYSI